MTPIQMCYFSCYTLQTIDIGSVQFWLKHMEFWLKHMVQTCEWDLILQKYGPSGMQKYGPSGTILQQSTVKACT